MKIKYIITFKHLNFCDLYCILKFLKMSDENDYPDPNQYSIPRKPGGYYNATIGEILHGRNGTYELIEYIGYGSFGTVFLARNIRDNSVKIVKIIRSAKHFTNAAKDEITMLQMFQGCEHIAQIVETIQIPDLNDPQHVLVHLCIIMEDHGKNLLSLIESKPDINTIKEISRQLFTAIEHMHSKGIGHSDIKPENVVYKYNSDGKLHITLIDLGSSHKPDNEWSETTTIEYRAPEIFMGLPFCLSSDIFSLGCLIFEMFTGEYCIQHKKELPYANEDHIAKIVELLNLPVNKVFTTNGFGRNIFTVNQITGEYEFIHIKDLCYETLLEILCNLYKYEKDISEEINRIILPMLAFNASDRISASDALLLLS